MSTARFIANILPLAHVTVQQFYVKYSQLCFCSDIGVPMTEMTPKNYRIIYNRLIDFDAEKVSFLSSKNYMRAHTYLKRAVVVVSSLYNLIIVSQLCKSFPHLFFVVDVAATLYFEINWKVLYPISCIILPRFTSSDSSSLFGMPITLFLIYYFK